MFVGLALGKNVATIIVCRALLGLFGCIGTILVGGTFGDMYRTEERAIPMASFSYVAILGTVGSSERGAGLPYISLVIGITLNFALNFFQIEIYESLAAIQTGKVAPEA